MLMVWNLIFCYNIRNMKKTEQVLRSGEITYDFDETLTLKQIDELMFSLFSPFVSKEGKQYILYNKIGILACNITYLGNPHPLYKKRIQLKTYYLEYLARNRVNNFLTLYLGIYTYKKTRLFVVFEPSTYAGKKSHNSSAHVYSINLQYAQKTGVFSKIDNFGNKISIFNTHEFVKYIKSLACDHVSISFDEILKLIYGYINSFKETIKPKWNGIDCYKEMINAKDNNAKQAEWPGWYFEFLFKKYLANNSNHLISWHGKKADGEIDLDLKFINGDWFFGDLKADQINHDILGNSLECLDTVIRKNGGTVYYICCLYKAEKDSSHGYQVTKYWDMLRGGIYAANGYKDMPERYGKRMKFSVEPKTICVLKIDSVTYEILRKNPFAQGINSDGKERKPKLKVQKDMIKALSIYSQNL